MKNIKILISLFILTSFINSAPNRLTNRKGEMEYIKKAMEYKNKGDIEKAISEYNEFFKKFSKKAKYNPFPFYFFGNLFAKQGNLKKAEELYEKGNKACPT